MSLIFNEISPLLRTKESLSTVVSHLNQWGCCVRCMLRFIGVKDANVFRTNDIASLKAWLTGISTPEDADTKKEKTKNPADISSINGVTDDLVSQQGYDVISDQHQLCGEVTRNIESENLASSGKQTVCTTCLGILQEHYCCTVFTDEIARAVCEQEFEFDSFLCSVSIPVCMLLREHGTLLALDRLMPSVYADIQRDSITPVKDVWKWVNGPCLASALKIPFDQKSPFEIVISFYYAQNDDECSFLYGLQPSIFKKRKKNQRQSQTTVDVFNRANVSRAIKESSEEQFCCAYKCPPTRPSIEVTVSPVVCQHASLYVAGRYTCLRFLNLVFSSLLVLSFSNAQCTQVEINTLRRY